MVFFTLRSFCRIKKEASPDSHGRVAIFGALLFAAHPVHVEAVTWLAARKEVLQGFFFFLDSISTSRQIRRPDEEPFTFT